jgi:type VI secretion system protein ImpB
MTFESMDDFSPAAVARKVDGLKEIFQTREKLEQLLTKVGSKPKLEKELQKALEQLPVKDQELGKKLLAELGGGEEKK